MTIRHLLSDVLPFWRLLAAIAIAATMGTAIWAAGKTWRLLTHPPQQVRQACARCFRAAATAIVSAGALVLGAWSAARRKATRYPRKAQQARKRPLDDRVPLPGPEVLRDGPPLDATAERIWRELTGQRSER